MPPQLATGRRIHPAHRARMYIIGASPARACAWACAVRDLSVAEPDHFLEHEEAHALHKRPLHLRHTPPLPVTHRDRAAEFDMPGAASLVG